MPVPSTYSDGNIICPICKKRMIWFMDTLLCPKCDWMQIDELGWDYRYVRGIEEGRKDKR
jgi:hypothetical protein